MAEAIIDVRGLEKRFGSKKVVNGIDLKIPEGQVWGFLGPNGSGKTTTIRMICGLLTPSAGQGTCLGFDILSQAKNIKARTGYMTQRFSFWEDLTIRENLEFVARVHRLKQPAKLVDQTLEKIGLAQRQHQLASALSGGWKQRLALAAVTMPKPKLLLLDEPTAGVDPQARREFWNEIHELAQTGVTVLVSTHYMDEAERCDQIVYLANGNLITQGSVGEVIGNSQLVSFRITGENVRQYSEKLKQEAGIDNVAYFTSALHVTGKDEKQIKASLSSPQYQALHLEQTPPELEDVFIALMKEAGIDRRDYQ